MVFEATRSVTLPVALATVLAQGQFVVVDSNGRLASPADGGGLAANVIGVTLEASTNAESDAIPVALLDGAKIEVRTGVEAITVGALVSTDASGNAKLANAANDQILGVALSAASTTDGDFITLLSVRGARAV